MDTQQNFIPKVLFVDDEPGVLNAMQRLFHDEPYELLTASGGPAALMLLQETGAVQLIISDYRMPVMNGSEFLQQVMQRWPDTRRVILSGFPDTDVLLTALNEGRVHRFFSKPWDDQNLKFAIRAAIEKYDLESENRRLLATVKQQSLEIKVVEKRYPGISRVEKDEQGVFMLPDISEEEIKDMLNACEKEAC